MPTSKGVAGIAKPRERRSIGCFLFDEICPAVLLRAAGYETRVAADALQGVTMPAPFERMIDLTIRNDPTELAAVSDSLERIGAALGMAPRPLMQLQVAVDEIAGNVIEHGWPQGGAHELHVRITAQRDRIKIEIADDGIAFDPRADADDTRDAVGGDGVTACTTFGPWSAPELGGVGIRIARNMIDGLDYARCGGHNRTVITKRHMPRPVNSRPVN